MSQTNYVVCLDCGEWLSIGKSVRFREPRLDRNIYGFAFINDGHDDDYENTLRRTADSMHKHWRYLQHFLMRHRGHELRVLPEQLVGPFENDFFPQYAPGDPLASLDYIPPESYYLSPTGVPDQLEEAKSAPQSVVDRLKEMSRGENLKHPKWDDED